MAAGAGRVVLRPRLFRPEDFLRFIDDRIAELVPPGVDVLDAGAGRGDLLGRIRARKKVALDLRTTPLHGAAVRGDVARLPIWNASFDAVLCVNVLPWLPSPGVAIAEFARVLRPGGRLLLDAFNLEHPLFRIRSLHWPRTMACGLRESWLRARPGFAVERCEWILPLAHNWAAGIYARLAVRFPRLAPHFVCVLRRD